MAILRLSYAELGARLGRSTDTARVLARRRGWQRVTGNNGRVAVMVDEAELAVAVGQLADNVVLLGDLRAALVDARVAAARAEGEAAGNRRAAAAEVAAAEAKIAALRELADRERDISRELRVELVQARRPWWKRLIG